MPKQWSASSLILKYGAIVRRKKPASVSIPAELAARAAFLAQVHRKKSLEEWLTSVIEERIELEEAAFIGVTQVYNCSEVKHDSHRYSQFSEIRC